MTDILETVHRILEYGDICDHCLGRMFAKQSFGLSNEQRGHALRVTHALIYNIPFHPYEKGTCWICNDIFDNIPRWVKKIVSALQDVEYSTFVIGTRVPPIMVESEEMIWSDLSIKHPEPIKSEMNREVGKAVSSISGKNGDPKNPEITIILNITEDTIELQIAPVYFYGRYFKYERGIPQTHWNCRACRGKGCEKCNFTGKQYPTSVEEMIAEISTQMFRAENGILHGSGREDIDALMIGTGRPFIMEMKNPKIRNINLKELEYAINTSAAPQVQVNLEKWSNKKTVEMLKSQKGHKTYRILVDIDGSISLETVRNAVSKLKGALIHQRTPKRVSHRRADLIRERKVIDIEFLGIEGTLYRIGVVGESGLYIKELISGDEGRTTPSLTEILTVPAKVVTLDVVQVDGIYNGDE
ncbi:MAG TPA: tRNA pseudouridine(54/55) synthase Pus10 [Methanocorpusculum sp.]|nr:tRNA pseudouridine(54/55) synthase Pus10 [Methanocorpusculum sp.]HJJ90283.1 tRNA pseudouridine(54/55) synthase Pus10 [Methanocorpusculum sp.]